LSRIPCNQRPLVLFSSRPPNTREQRPLLAGNGQNSCVKTFSREITKLLWQRFLHLVAKVASRVKDATYEDADAMALRKAAET